MQGNHTEIACVVEAALIAQKLYFHICGNEKLLCTVYSHFKEIVYGGYPICLPERAAKIALGYANKVSHIVQGNRPLVVLFYVIQNGENFPESVFFNVGAVRIGA